MAAISGSYGCAGGSVGSAVPAIATDSYIALKLISGSVPYFLYVRLGSVKFSVCYWSVAYLGILFGGVQQIQLRTEDRENGDLGALAP
jgi:hypothetical protein